MYDNIGNKIKSLATAMCVIGIICSIITGIVIIANAKTEGYYYSYSKSAWNGTLVATGIAVMVLGSIASWIGSWVTYAIGEIAVDVNSNSMKLERIEGLMNKAEKRERVDTSVSGTPAGKTETVRKDFGFDTTELKEILTSAAAILDDTVQKKELRSQRNELEKLGRYKESDIIHQILNSGDIHAALAQTLQEIG